STTASVERARADARELELLFAFALGFERPLTLALAEQPNGSTLTSERDIEALLTLASAARPEISAAKARYQAQLVRAHLASERIQFLPTVSAGPRRQDGELRGVAGLDVVLPIFDSGAVAEREQRAGLLAAAVELRRTAQQVAGEVSAALLRLETAESALTGSAGELAQRRRALREQTERLFAAGEVDYAELVSARRGEAEAQLARLDAERAASAARVEFDFATGAFERAVHEHISAENP
ncbi:MAG: TolC family protein, partial [Planctomycetota bacterium]|nr:TolC family protein [Planctomycetota bacterium]